MESTSLHEAVPGHHLQLAKALEVTGLPTFRRFIDWTAFEEGWALYSESLGAEMGFYTDPYNRFGAYGADSAHAHAHAHSRDFAITHAGRAHALPQGTRCCAPCAWSWTRGYTRSAGPVSKPGSTCWTTRR